MLTLDSTILLGLDELQQKKHILLGIIYKGRRLKGVGRGVHQKEIY